MPKVTLYTRPGCCLCREAKEVLEAARVRSAFDFEEIDIDRDQHLRALYNDEVPVIAIDGRKAFKYKVGLDQFLRKLAGRS